MKWFYFDLVKVTGGYILVEEDGGTIQEGGKAKIFQTYEDAERWLHRNDHRGSIRNVVDPSAA